LAGRAAKGGKAIHSTAKGMKAVDNSLSAYQYGKSLDVLKYSFKLDKKLYIASDEKQFKRGTELLKNAITNNKISKESFTELQLEQIFNGEPRIHGLTWHHHQVLGKMQLVVSDNT